MCATSNFELPISQRILPKYYHYCQFFMVLVITFHRIHLFLNRFHWWSTFWPLFFFKDSYKSHVCGKKGKVIIAILTKKSIMAILAPILNDNMSLMGFYRKNSQNVNHLWKLVMKKNGSYKELWPKQTKSDNNGNFWAILFKIGNSKKGVAHLEKTSNLNKILPIVDHVYSQCPLLCMLKIRENHS